ncbi:hypothetical protein SteCoe_6626 [Stentor coeruleus]|uniref:Polymerase nucleotidyl transferase domain-containing protein n=1 Tax=Stentor coeruleus TaxID=5963 RepID=A0A1R2CPM8_9CILI|nr:hypothetical protein SteCoe_6626 [Stentor coeruleus]
MVTLYGPDTLNMLRSASETLSLGFQSQTYINKAKKWVKTQYLELFKKNENCEDLTHYEKILVWLKSCPIYSRVKIISHEAPLICTFIWQMFIKKLSDGELDFFLNEGSLKCFDPDNFDQNFKMVKKTPKAQSISNLDFQIEKSFERSLRLTDSEEYLDTLTLDMELLNDPDKLIDYMKSLSQGKAFKTPCHATWDNNSKAWIWEYPAWFSPGKYTSLAAWACASIEKSIWINYWKCFNLDPVSQKSLLHNFSYKEKSNIVKSCQLLENLANYFSMLKHSEKEKIVGSIDEISQDYIVVREQMTNFSTKCVNYNTIPRSATFYPSSHLCFPFYPHPFTSFYSYTEKTNIKYYQSHESVSSILQRLKGVSDYKFIEFLLCSPLERSVTILDIVVRKVLYRVVNAYTEKNALDLILNEKSFNPEPKSKNNQKKTKKPKSRAKKPKAKKDQPNLKQTISIEEKGQINSFIEEIINKMIFEAGKIKENHDNIIKESIEKSAEFQEVLSQKKKHKKIQPQQKAKNPNKKPTKHCRKPLKPLSPQNDIQTLNPQKPNLSNNKPSELPQTPISSLHKEIITFSETMAWRLQNKILCINKILEKFSEIITLSFHNARIELFGSFASGLAIEASDVDIVITGLEFHERQELEMACDYLATILRNYTFISKLNAIHTARIPVIKLEINTMSIVGIESLIMFDITFDDSYQGNFGTHLGLSTLYLTKELELLYPSLLYLVLVLKKFLYTYELNSAYKGGLSSYSLVLWVAALLNSMTVVSENLGELLIEFFKFFGTEFDPNRTGINIINGGSFFELDVPGYEAVVTIDPVNQLNNTRMSYRINEVLKAFRSAYEILTESIEKGRMKKLLKNVLRKKKNPTPTQGDVPEILLVS